MCILVVAQLDRRPSAATLLHRIHVAVLRGCLGTGGGLNKGDGVPEGGS